MSEIERPQTYEEKVLEYYREFHDVWDEYIDTDQDIEHIAKTARDQLIRRANTAIITLEKTAAGINIDRLRYDAAKYMVETCKEFLRESTERREEAKDRMTVLVEKLTNVSAPDPLDSTPTPTTNDSSTDTEA